MGDKENMKWDILLNETDIYSVKWGITPKDISSTRFCLETPMGKTHLDMIHIPTIYNQIIFKNTNLLRLQT